MIDFNIPSSWTKSTHGICDEAGTRSHRVVVQLRETGRVGGSPLLVINGNTNLESHRALFNLNAFCSWRHAASSLPSLPSCDPSKPSLSLSAPSSDTTSVVRRVSRSSPEVCCVFIPVEWVNRLGFASAANTRCPNGNHSSGPSWRDGEERRMEVAARFHFGGWDLQLTFLWLHLRAHMWWHFWSLSCRVRPNCLIASHVTFSLSFFLLPFFLSFGGFERSAPC